MDCRRVDELLVDYLYQELDPSQVDRFEAHLERCSRCSQELNAYERTRSVLRDLPEKEPPARVTELLLKEAARATVPAPPSLWERLRTGMRMMVLHPAMTAAVTLFLVLGISFYIYRSSAPMSSRSKVDLPVLDSEIPLPGGSATISMKDREPPVAAEKLTEEAADGVERIRGLGQAKAAGTAETARELAGKLEVGPRGDRAGKAMAGALGKKTASTYLDRLPAEPPRGEQPLDGYKNKERVVLRVPAQEEAGSRGDVTSGEQRKVLKPSPPAPQAVAEAAPPPASPVAKAKAPVPVARRQARVSDEDDQGQGLGWSDTASIATGGAAAPGPEAARDKRAAPARRPAASRSESAPVKQEPEQQKGRKGTDSPSKQQARLDLYLARAEKASSEGRWFEALTHFAYALDLRPDLETRIANGVRACAVQLGQKGEAPLLKAQKLYPGLARILEPEVARARQARQARTSQQAQARRRARSQPGADEAKKQAGKRAKGKQPQENQRAIKRNNAYSY